MKRGPPFGTVLAVALVLLVLVEGFPAQAFATTVVDAPRAGTPTTATIDRSASPISQTVRTPTSGPGFESLCLLGVLPRCHPTSPGTSTSARPLASGPVSSWTNVTPPPGLPNPSLRILPSMTYYPSGHEVLLFGGFGCALVCQDTWSFAQSKWTELISNSSCTATSCPSPRAYAMMAYYAPLNAVLLFGGGVSFFGVTHTYGDTWLFYSGQWHNITSTAGPAPSPRWAASLAWDSLDNYVLLFGGALAGGQTLGDTWTFNGTWHNISASLSASPLPRAGAAMTDSPSGYILLFGGEEWNGATDVVLYDDPGSCFLQHVSWWYYQGQWIIMKYSSCPNVPRISTFTPPGFPSPCGRVNAALGWSPKNDRFVLYGGYGAVWTSGAHCGGTAYDYLNDTWSYLAPPGGASGTSTMSNWGYTGDSGDPSNRSATGYATDFTGNYFEIFGGEYAAGGFNSTWRYYSVVHAKLTGPTSLQTNASILSFSEPFKVVGYGGSGTLDYTFHAAKMRNANDLTDSGSSYCNNLTSGSVFSLPYDGAWSVPCSPTAASYNVYRLTLYVWDANNSTLSGGVPVSGDYATANWTFTVEPPESAVLYSEFTKYFYEGFDFNNLFGAYLKVAGQPASSVSATLGGLPIGFAQRSPNSYWWNSSVIDMGHVSPGSVLRVTGNWNGWTLNATYTVDMVTTPSWLYSLFVFTGATQQTPTFGSGPYNKVYAIYENYSWSPAGSSSFALPTPMLSGDYNIIPTIAVTFSANSAGTLAISGNLTITPPAINFGVVSLSLDVAIGLAGQFTVVNASQGISDVQWGNVQATLTLGGDLGASIPIYGFNVLGVQVGFTLKLDLTVALALTLLLLPTTAGFNEIIPGVEMMVSQLVGAITLGLSAAVVFGIGFASVSIGIATSIALAFNVTPTFHIGAGWLNGTFFAAATFLWWNVTWQIVGPGVIYTWLDPPSAAVSSPTLCARCYNNGGNATWQPESRYYVTGGYDSNVWNASLTQGPAVSHIYPHTEVSGAGGFNGGYLFYSDDNGQVPVQQGLHVAGLRLDSSTNQLSPLPSPSDPGFVTDHPEATTLSDGSLYVVWAAVPSSETSLSSPADLTSVPLHGARFYPSNQSWGPVRSWTTWGFAQAYQLDRAGALVALVGPSFLTGNTAVERLVEFDLASGREVANMSVTGLSEIASVSAGLGGVVVQNLGGNFSMLNLTTGATVPVSLPLPLGSLLISESFVTGAPSTLLVLFRSPDASEVVLYDLASHQIIANRTTDQSASMVEAIYGDATYYVFEEVHAGVQGWTESNGQFSNLRLILESNLETFGLVQVGSSILVYSLAATGQPPQPILTLEFAEVGAILPAISGPPATPGQPTSGGPSTSNYLLYLGIVAAADVLLLAVIALWRRRRSRSGDRSAPASPSIPPSEGPTIPPPQA
jgi:hypothetical protein